MTCQIRFTGGYCTLDEGHDGNCNTKYPGFLDGVNTRLDDLQSRIHQHEVHTSGIFTQVTAHVVILSEVYRRLIALESAQAGQAPEELRTVAPDEPNDFAIGDWVVVEPSDGFPRTPGKVCAIEAQWLLVDFGEQDRVCSIHHSKLRLTAEPPAVTPRPPVELPAIGTRVRIEVSHPRVAKVVAHVGEGVEVELPGDSKRLWIAACDVRTEG